MTMRGTRVQGLFLLALGVGWAQIGLPPTYPGGSPLPGGRTPRLPIPSRGGKDAKKDTKSDSKKGEPVQPLPSFRGFFRQMDEKQITLEMGDNRVLDFRRTSKTRFFAKGEEVKTPSYKAGDEISIEGTQDIGGYL